MPDFVTITKEWFELLSGLPTVQSRWNVLYAVAWFSFDGREPDDLDALEKSVFMNIKPKIQNRKRVANCYAKRKARPLDSALESTLDSNGQALDSTLDSNGELPLYIEDCQEIFKQDNTIDSSKDFKKEKEIKSSTNSTMKEKDKSSPEKRNIFVPPTLEEVREYCQFRRNAVDPEEFHAYYTANNWMVGHGNKMKDFKAAIRYWERSMYNRRKKLTQTRDYSGI